jgi:allantoinase
VSPRAELAIRGATVVSDGALARDILIRDGRISALVEAGAADADAEIDARGLLALPGVVDAHVHFNDPGREDWEGWASGARAAAAGGTTTVLDMPLNSLPPVLDGAAFDAKRAAAERGSVVDFGLWGGLIDADADRLRALRERGAIGVKAFLCSSGVPEFPSLRDEELMPALRAAAAADLLVAVHAEDDMLVREATARVREQDRRDAGAWSASRPPLVEVRAVARACAAAREAGARIHVVHLSAFEALGAIGAARDAGVDVTVETCPHYLTFDETDIALHGAGLKCAPPIRDARNRDGLWRALLDGRIDLVASDHSPCPARMKVGGADGIFDAWGGIAGVQSLLPAIFTAALVRSGGALDVRKVAGFVAWRLSARPAKRFGLWPRKGAIARGSDADIVLFDPAREWTLTREASLTRGVDPYVGRSFRGRVVRTLVRGRTVYQLARTRHEPQPSGEDERRWDERSDYGEDGIATGVPRGQFLAREDGTAS